VPILALHNRYRTLGGEERAVEDLVWLAREHLGEEVELLVRDSSGLSRRAAATGLLRGGLDPEEVGAAVRRAGADIVHAHNLLPSFGWRALAAARAAGAKTVLHLHNYRLVCAVATCVDPAGNDCTRCHGRNTAPGVRLGCRGTAVEGVVYAAALAAWQRRTLELADAVVVPSTAAKKRLLALGLPVESAYVIPHVVRSPGPSPSHGSRYRPDGPVLIASRLAVEKGIENAIEGCRAMGVGLVIAGDGPHAERLRRRTHELGLQLLEGLGSPPSAGQVRFVGRIEGEQLAELRASAGVEVVASRAHETFGLAAVEGLAAGLPVVASAVGALASLPAPVRLAPVDDLDALAAAIEEARGDHAAADAGPSVAARMAGTQVVTPALARVYALLRQG
jgi:glycosyltransferase involved in cell wall biosynthesis